MVAERLESSLRPIRTEMISTIYLEIGEQTKSVALATEQQHSKERFYKQWREVIDTIHESHPKFADESGQLPRLGIRRQMPQYQE